MFKKLVERSFVTAFDFFRFAGGQLWKVHVILSCTLSKIVKGKSVRSHLSIIFKVSLEKIELLIWFQDKRCKVEIVRKEIHRH